MPFNVNESFATRVSKALESKFDFISLPESGSTSLSSRSPVREQRGTDAEKKRTDDNLVAEREEKVEA